MPLPSMCIDCNRVAAPGDCLCDICRERHDERLEGLRQERRAEEALKRLREAIDLGGVYDAEETT